MLLPHLPNFAAQCADLPLISLMASVKSGPIPSEQMSPRFATLFIPGMYFPADTSISVLRIADCNDMWLRRVLHHLATANRIDVSFIRPAIGR